MSGEAERRRLRIRSLVSQGRAWLMRPRTIRILGPVVFLLGVALVGIGVMLWGGDGGGRAGGPGGVSGTAFPVPPRAVRGIAYPVPPRLPFADFNLVIDAIGVNARVLNAGVDFRGVPEVPYDGEKVAWYEFTALPGTGSNAVMAGHVRWAGDPAVFADLDKLETGDVIRVKWKDGRELSYEVFKSLAVNVRDPNSLQVMAPTDADIITLITCRGTFVADANNPLGGDFTQRTVVRARLVEPSVRAISR